MPRHKPWRLELTLMLLALLSSGCGHGSPLSKPVPGPQIPPLPVAARQPAMPPTCLPTCSANASAEFDRWLSTPTPPASPVKPASAPTNP